MRGIVGGSLQFVAGHASGAGRLSALGTESVAGSGRRVTAGSTLLRSDLSPGVADVPAVTFH